MIELSNMVHGLYTGTGDACPKLEYNTLMES